MDLPNRVFVPHSTVVLIGYGNDGPANELIYVDNTVVTDLLYGATSQLALAIHDCYNNGARSVLAVRINGVNASVNVQDKFRLIQRNAGSKYNGEKVVIDGDILTIGTYSYELHDFGDIRSLVYIINYDCSVNKHSYKAEIVNDTPISELINGEAIFTGGIDEPEGTLPPIEIHGRLENIYFMLLGYPVNIILPLCAPLDSVVNPEYDFGKQLIDHCLMRFTTGEDVVGILPTKVLYAHMQTQNIPKEVLVERKVEILSNLGDVYNFTNHLLRSYNMDENGNQTTNGRFLSVVASDLIYTNGVGRITNGAAAYAGLLSYDPFSSTSNKTIEGTCVLPYEYTKDQMEDVLTRLVAFQYTIRNGICVYRGNTMYPEFSISTSKIINHINYVLQDGLKDINEVSNQQVAMAQIAKIANQVLKPLVDNKEIREFTIDVEEVNFLTKEIKLTVDFIRYGEVRHIITQAGVYYGI
jgi:hypothetical protein